MLGFRGWPCRTNLEIENVVDWGADFCTAVWYSSRIWCRTFRTVFPTECSSSTSHDDETRMKEHYNRSRRQPFGWASMSLLPTLRMISTSWSMFVNRAFDTTCRRTNNVSKAALRDPTTCLDKICQVKERTGGQRQKGYLLRNLATRISTCRWCAALWMSVGMTGCFIYNVKLMRMSYGLRSGP
jgi:hypothetical protein